MKKLKFLFLGALLCGFALNSNAQSETKKGDRSNWHIWFACDGVWDVIEGPMYIHAIDHYDPVTGTFEWYKFIVKSDELVCKNTGEIFSVNQYWRGTLDADKKVIIHFNLRGDQGSHILVSKIRSYDSSIGIWTLTFKQAKCM